MQQESSGPGVVYGLGAQGKQHSSTLFIWKLKYGITEEELQDAITRFSTGFVRMKFQAPEAHRWGQAWVLFETPEFAANAKDAFACMALSDGENMAVDFAKNDLDSPANGQNANVKASAKAFHTGQKGQKGGAMGGSQQRNTLYVWKLKFGCTEDELQNGFQALEGFTRLKFQPVEGDRAGQCWAQFESHAHAAAAKVTLSTMALPSDPDELLAVDFAKNDLDAPASGKGAGAAFATTGMYNAPGAWGKGIPGGNRSLPYQGKAGAALRPVAASTSYSAKQMVVDFVNSGKLPGGKWRNDENTVVVGGLPLDTTDRELYIMFTPFGAILPGGASIATHRDGSLRGFALINFQTQESAQHAIIAMEDCELPDGSRLTAKLWEDGTGLVLG